MVGDDETGAAAAAGGAVSQLAQQLAELSRQSTSAPAPVTPPTGGNGDGGNGGGYDRTAFADSISQISKKVVENLPSGGEQQQQQGPDQQQDQQQDQNSNSNNDLRARSPLPIAEPDTPSSYSTLGISSSSGDSLPPTQALMVGDSGDSGDGDSGHLRQGSDWNGAKAVTPSSGPGSYPPGDGNGDGGVAGQVKKGIEALGKLVQAQAQGQGNGGNGGWSEEQRRAAEEKRAEDEAKALI